jgi:hypothetical protein
MEIIETGDLRRISYENTADVQIRQTFQGIYGVGMCSINFSITDWHSLPQANLLLINGMRLGVGASTTSRPARVV